MLFLIEYDRPKGSLIKLIPFADADRGRADAQRLELEIDLNRRSIDHEVVLLDAADENALRRTHRRYFEDDRQIGSAMNDALSRVGDLKE